MGNEGHDITESINTEKKEGPVLCCDGKKLVRVGKRPAQEDSMKFPWVSGEIVQDQIHFHFHQGRGLTLPSNSEFCLESLFH